MSNAISVELAEFLVLLRTKVPEKSALTLLIPADVCTVKPAWDSLSRISKVRSACLNHSDISGLPTS